MRLTFLVTAIVLFYCQAVCDARVYRLVEASILEGREFGYAGEITTDGSLGILPNTDFVQSWSINVTTPSDIDGIATEQLTPQNSTLSLDLGDTPGLEVTENAIQFALHLRSFATLTWTGPTSILRFGNRSTNGSVGVHDMFSGIGVIRDEPAIARVVPEPTTFLLSAFAAMCLLLPPKMRRR